VKVENFSPDPRLITLEEFGLFCSITVAARASDDGMCRHTDGHIAKWFADSNTERSEDAFRQKINGLVLKLVGKGVVENAEPSRRQAGGRPTRKGLRPLVSVQTALRMTTKVGYDEVTQAQTFDKSGLNPYFGQASDPIIVRSNDQIPKIPIICVEKEMGMNLVDKIPGNMCGDLTKISLIDSAVRQVLDSIEHRREMAELAASHWGKVIVPEPVKIIQPEPIAQATPKLRMWSIRVIGGVRQVEGTSFKDAEQKIIAEVEAYRESKCSW
jgi:hypothetical protein